MDGQPVEGLIEEKPKKKRGCFFWGCLTSVIVLLALGGCITIGVYQMIQKFTAPEAVPIPKAIVREGQIEEIRQRFERFDQAAQEGQPSELIIKADDLNALIADVPALEPVAGKAFVKIEDSQIRLEVSIPADEILPMAKGRHLNGTISLGVAIEGGQPSLLARSGLFNDQPVPEPVLEVLSRMINDGIRNSEDEKVQEFFRSAKSIEVQGDQIVITR